MKETFSSPEISLAASMLSYNYPLDHIAHEAGTNRVHFVFLSTHDLLHLVQLYWQKELLVNVHTFYENLKFLKARLRNGTTEARD